MDTNGHQWTPMDTSGHQWTPVETSGHRHNSAGVDLFARKVSRPGSEKYGSLRMRNISSKEGTKNLTPRRQDAKVSEGAAWGSGERPKINHAPGSWLDPSAHAGLLPGVGSGAPSDLTEANPLTPLCYLCVLASWREIFSPI
jgi:hypothetical protein